MENGLTVAIGKWPLILNPMTLLYRLTLALVIAPLFAPALWAADSTLQPEETLIQPAGDSDLSEFVWKKRPILVFADSPSDPAFIEQMSQLEARADALSERDVVVLTDTDPDVLSPLRKKLRPRGFMLVILSKEGAVQLRKPFPWSVREISRSIDKLPIRQQEIRDRRNGS